MSLTCHLISYIINLKKWMISIVQTNLVNRNWEVKKVSGGFYGDFKSREFK